MPVHRHRRQYEKAVVVREKKNHRAYGRSVVSSASSQPSRPFWPDCKEMMRGVDKRDVAYTSSRLGTPSPYQYGGRLLHQQSRNCSANFIPIYDLNTDSTLITGPCVWPYHCKASYWRTFGSVSRITCAANDTRSPSPPFGVLSRNWMEPG